MRQNNVHLCFAVLLFFVTSSCFALPRIDDNPGRRWQCSETEFQCTSGQCVRIGALCDGEHDCDDKSDEEFCTLSNAQSSLINFIKRSKRQTTRKCGKYKWMCRSGECVAINGKCNGTVDCRDGSDESYATCRNTKCPTYLFRCAYGACVDNTAKCNNVLDCRDNSNELNSDCKPRSASASCGKSKWTCRNGECIAINGKCNGTVDCQDGSDESYATCRNTKCPTYLFRCAYGACVENTTKCNNKQDCRDNSDELNLDCKPRRASTKCGKEFECNNGECIAQHEHCNGVADCTDGSDETVLQCSQETCSGFSFRCAYGACVNRSSNCDQVIDCADGSDESYDLCNMALPVIKTPTPKPSAVSLFSGSGCIVPPLSAGPYKVEPDNQYGPGEEVPLFTGITFNCSPGSSLPGNQNFTLCVGPNSWTNEPICKRNCRALQSMSVSFKCSAPDGRRLSCDVPVEEGTIARPTCKTSYVPLDILPQLTCLEGGSWDNTVKCKPDCGTITPKGKTLIVNGRDADHGEFPWHVGIFEVSDESSGYTNICGGTIVNAALVISAAHCFYIDGVGLKPADRYAVAAGKLFRSWDSPNDDPNFVGKIHVVSAHCFYIDGVGLKPADRYAVAAGKLFRSWDSPNDDPNFVQKSFVKEILISEFYGGITRNYQADLALLVLTTLLTFSSIVKPVCIDYELRLEQLQLVKGEYGKVPGWGLLAEDGLPSEVLKTANLPYVPYSDCVASLPVTFQPFLLTDKICAGWTNGTAVCKGDSGGGLVFNRTDVSSIVRFYLRGIVSNSPLNDAKTSCHSDNFAVFTKVSAYRDFVNQIWSQHQPQ